MCFTIYYPDNNINYDTRGEESYVRIKWNEENNEVVVNKICENIDNLINTCNINDICQENINICIDIFTNELNDFILPFCSVTTHKTNKVDYS